MSGSHREFRGPYHVPRRSGPNLGQFTFRQAHPRPHRYVLTYWAVAAGDGERPAVQRARCAWG